MIYLYTELECIKFISVILIHMLIKLAIDIEYCSNKSIEYDTARVSQQ